ncbi:unnamed protein product [Effrenium voratum]|uniref:Uncharacterized protein n=1 Tax=Effrenium voratum TaxID=2562239 RepID=A0AA36NKN2_9DINO|nr:unnamed protein product [Effrenium voratum]
MPRMLLFLLFCCLQPSEQKVWYPAVDDQIEGCYTVSADLTDDHSLASCGGKQCPNCFQLDTSSSAITLTITNCHYVNGVALTGQAVFLYTFYNTGLGSAFVKDGSAAGAREYFIRPMGQGDAATTCMCKDGELACSADTPEVLKVTASGPPLSSAECGLMLVAMNGSKMNETLADMAAKPCQQIWPDWAGMYGELLNADFE